MRNLLAATLALTLLGHAVASAQAAPPPPQTQPPKSTATQAGPPQTQPQPPKSAATQAAPPQTQPPKVVPVQAAPQTTQKPPAAKPAVPGPVVPTEPGFTIGPADVLGILVWREPEMSGDVTVRLDGMVSLPLMRDIEASGLTPNELADRIQAAAREFITDASVTVVVRQMNSRRVFITGEVAKPGAYSLATPMTVMQLIAVAGGLTEFASTKSISILRVEAGRTRTFPFDYKNVANGKKSAQNIVLKPGDTVVVPER